MQAKNYGTMIDGRDYSIELNTDGKDLQLSIGDLDYRKLGVRLDVGQVERLMGALQIWLNYRKEGFEE